MHHLKATSSADGSAVFLYRKHRPVEDWIILPIYAGLFLWFVARVWTYGIRSGWDLAPLLLIVFLIQSLEPKAKLQIRELDFEHLTRTGMPETIRFDAVGEIIETSFNLLIVHQTKKGWMRLDFAKSDFCQKCWPRIVSLLKERTRTHSPSASIVDCVT